ncbi:hypothetical protein M2271_007804 [Streptomyces sp. LBL]|nr:hypothetical protein [Streptomyces sp. LBL]
MRRRAAKAAAVRGSRTVPVLMRRPVRGRCPRLCAYRCTRRRSAPRRRGRRRGRRWTTRGGSSPGVCAGPGRGRRRGGRGRPGPSPGRRWRGLWDRSSGGGSRRWRRRGRPRPAAATVHAFAASRGGRRRRGRTCRSCGSRDSRGRRRRRRRAGRCRTRPRPGYFGGTGRSPELEPADLSQIAADVGQSRPVAQQAGGQSMASLVGDVVAEVHGVHPGPEPAIEPLMGQRHRPVLTAVDRGKWASPARWAPVGR